MIKKTVISIFFFLILISGFLNYKVLRSFIDQSLLMYEFNAYQLNLSPDYARSLNVDFPNITVTTLPLKMLKARYLMRDSAVAESLELFYQSRKDNQFLGISEFELSKYHFNTKNIDSALYYSKIAFEALPRNALLSNLHFKVLTKLKKDSLLDESFNKIKENFILEQWRDYLFSKVEIGKTSKEDLIKILDEAQGNMIDEKQFSTLDVIIRLGMENLNELGKIIIQAETFYLQENFIEGAVLYEKAARLNTNEYTHYENAALSYYRGNYFEESENLFRYTLSSFNPQNGKSELYLGLLLYEKKEKKEACKFWKISKQKGFSGSQRVIDTFCK